MKLERKCFWWGLDLKKYIYFFLFWKEMTACQAPEGWKEDGTLRVYSLDMFLFIGSKTRKLYRQDGRNSRKAHKRHFKKKN
jgi:hypothetical protein